MPTLLRGSLTQVQVIHDEAIATYSEAINLQDEVEEIDNKLPREGGEVTMLQIIMCIH